MLLIWCEICNVGPVSDVVGEGESSLIFIVYPQALATMVFFIVLINYLYLADFHWAVSFTQFMVEDHPSWLTVYGDVAWHCQNARADPLQTSKWQIFRAI